MARALKKKRAPKRVTEPRRKRGSVVSGPKKVTRKKAHATKRTGNRVKRAHNTTTRDRKRSSKSKATARQRKIPRKIHRAVPRKPAIRKRGENSASSSRKRKAAPKSERRTTRKLERDLASARSAIRQRDRLIRDLTRHPIGVDRPKPGNRKTPVGGFSEKDTPSLPPGAKEIPGYPGAFTMGAYVEGASWEDIDWEDVDWDDYFDDVGPEEEEVDYGGTEK